MVARPLYVATWGLAITWWGSLLETADAGEVMTKKNINYAKTQQDNLIESTFVDHPSYHIGRQFVSSSTITSQLLKDLITNGIPREGESSRFPKSALRKLGDAGDLEHVGQYDVADFGAALYNFTAAAAHYRAEQRKHNGKLPQLRAPEDQHSLVYYLEQMDGPSLERSKDILSSVVSPSFLEQSKNTIHLYLSAPGTAALGNHTDTTDIVVLQLEGAKEWFLCREQQGNRHQATTAEESSSSFVRRSPTSKQQQFSRKLDACSTYDTTEIASHLECERTVLYPGDLLFLPRRTVHSARSLSDTYSAHLTFGYGDDEENHCWDNDNEQSSRDLLCFFPSSCDACRSDCDHSCDLWGVLDCDSSCDECNSSCDKCI